MTAVTRTAGGNLVLALGCEHAKTEAEENAFSLYAVICEGLGECGIRLCRTLAARDDGGVIAVLPSELSTAQTKAVEEAEDEGVTFLPASCTQAELCLAVKAALAANRRIEKLLREKRTLLKKIDDIRIVDRAKLILMQNMGYTEAQAHKQIEKRAMNERLSRAEVAMNILKTYEV